MNKKIFGYLLSLALIAPVSPVLAGGGEVMVEAPTYDEELTQIGLMEADMLLQQGVPFYDCNTLETWSQGFIPGAIFLSVPNWKELLPKDKDQTIVFYCLNKLCESSEYAARQVMQLGYTDVRQMPAGIQGWIKSNRKTERP